MHSQTRCFVSGKLLRRRPAALLLAVIATGAACFALLPARDASPLSQLRLAIRYELIRPGMTVAEVERLMSGTYAVRGCSDLARCPDSRVWNLFVRREDILPDPTHSPLAETFTGEVLYLHDPFRGNRIDVAGVKFRQGEVIQKAFHWDD